MGMKNFIEYASLEGINQRLARAMVRQVGGWDDFKNDEDQGDGEGD